MEITWLGQNCFRLRGREAVALTDPCPPSTGFKIGKVGADVVTISHDGAESNYRQAVQGEAKFVSAPGEYEIASILITGVRTRRDKKDGQVRNVAFVLDIDDIRVCHLGLVSQVPHADDVEQLVGCDVLLVPVGGGGALNARAAAEAVSLLEPKIVIPMRFKTAGATGDLEGVDRFLKEIGAESRAPEARLNVTKSSLPADTTVVVLEPRG
ncbi:MAG TPA: MBL fold metallo-hydrolase [Dehalococcoidia bacterium]|nr:MBL fold metallo-hydrolase [Dehalococcoidia bacterium]